MKVKAIWESTPKRGPFCGVWHLRQIPDDEMVCCAPGVFLVNTFEEAKITLKNMGNGHPVRAHR